MFFSLWILFLFCLLTRQDLAEDVNKTNHIVQEELFKIYKKPFGTWKDVEYTTVKLELPKNLNDKNFLNLTLPLRSSLIQLNLRPDGASNVHDNFKYLITIGNSSQNVKKNIFKLKKCFYTQNKYDLKAFIDVCDGLNGFVLSENTLFFVRPLLLNNSSKSSTNTHLIIKMNNGNEIINEKNSFEYNKRIKRSFYQRKNVKVETAIFIDRDLYRHMQNNFPNDTERNLFRFVLAMINAVQLLYHDASLEFKISFVLKRLEVLYTDPPQLQRSHDIDRYLINFCSWQEKENVLKNNSPMHWDHALMLTGLDLYAIGKSGKLSNQVLGLAPVAGMCKPSSSCTVNEGLHFESVYVVAHEIGHNLGMRHDGPSAENECDPSSHIMSPTLGSGKSTWSPCSNRYLGQFLESPQAKCLFDTSQIELDHSEGGKLPGERFDADHQCMLKYGKLSERSLTQNIEEICRDLRCTKERYTWTSHPALEGTKCGLNKWCRFGRCIYKEQEEMFERITDGGWSSWSSYSDCASACLLGNSYNEIGSTGITIMSRTCNNPRPQNGGRICKGHDKKYKTCAAMQCSNVPPLTVKEFAEQICRRGREVDKNLIGIGFQKNDSNAEEACTVWCRLFNGGAKSKGWIFPDGTACRTNTPTNNPMFCVSGRCEEFHCYPGKESTFVATEKFCKSEFTQIPVSDISWKPIGPCRYNCITPATGLRVLKRGTKYNIQLCQSLNCNKKTTFFEYATSLCSRYKSRVKKISGLGTQLAASLEDPDRPCHVACQDEKVSHRFYLVTGEDGWFPFGIDCSRGTPGKRAYCISGKCLEFGKNNMPKMESKLTFINVRRKRSFDLQNKTVIATVDSLAVQKLIDILNEGESQYSNFTALTIDFENPIHVKPEWENMSSILENNESNK